MNGENKVRRKPGPKPHELTEKQARFLSNIEKGKSSRQAALAAGYCESTASKAGQKIVPLLRVQFERALKKRSGIVEKLAQRIDEGLDATETMYFPFKGQVIDERTRIDHMTRYRYCDLATTLIGAQISRQQHEGPDGGPMQLQVAVMHIGRPDAQVEHRHIEQPQPQDVVVSDVKQKVIDVSD